MFDSELVHQALVVGVAGFCGRPWANGFNHGFDADQTIPDSRIGWHEVAAFGRERNHVGLAHAGWEIEGKVEALTNTRPHDVLEASVVGHPLLEWARHVAQIRLGCVVKQGRKPVFLRHQLGDDAAMLGHAVELAGVAVEAAQVAAMLGQVAAAGDIGAFGPKEMAKYLPAMLGNIKRLGMEGPEAVRFLGASLQSQYSQTQDSAAAATNMNNLLNAVISNTSQERFAKEGYDLAGSILAATKSGKAANPVDAFIMLSEQLIRKQDPAKAKKIEALKAKIKASADGSAEEEQAMVALTEAAGLANIVSDQSASAGLLAQIKYGDKIKADMATIEKTDGKAKIEADAAKARETSNRKWATATAGIESSMTRIGDALRPLTDMAADGLAKLAYGLGELAGRFPTVISGATVLAAGVVSLGAAINAIKIGKGLMNVARGSLMGNPNVIQRVFVTNPSGGAGGVDVGDGKRRRGKGKRGRGGRGAIPGAAAAAAPLGATASRFAPKAMMGKGLGFAKVGAPMALIEAGLIAADTYQNAETRDEKAEGYGNAAGTLAGTLAGAAAGAAIGSVVPVIGTVVGGLIGGFLGSWGGGELGGAVGKAAFGGPDAPIERLAQPSPLLLSKPDGPGVSRLAQLAPTPSAGPLVGDVARSLATAPSAAAVPALLSAGAAVKPEPARVDQTWTFAPTMPVTVQGDVKDPRQLVQEMMPHLRQLFEEFSREQGRRNLFDAPHV